jgi:hypothetical protein
MIEALVDNTNVTYKPKMNPKASKLLFFTPVGNNQVNYNRTVSVDLLKSHLPMG